MEGLEYINEIDIQPPSPSSGHLDLTRTFDYDFSPPFPHTPSYNGSYDNSPFSNNSELSFGENESFSLFDDDPNGPILDYDPSQYDAPHSSSLLVFNDNDYMSGFDNQVSVTVASTSADLRGSPYDYSSPSSNGGGDSGQDGEIRSRASSVSSNPIPQISPSPRMEVAGSFENMSFHSPNWGTHPLPQDRSLTPPKPQSPPQLMIPDSSSPSGSCFPPPPTINAPSGDGGLMSTGPQLHIVPATPVSGGGVTPQANNFQSRLDAGESFLFTSGNRRLITIFFSLLCSEGHR